MKLNLYSIPLLFILCCDSFALASIKVGNFSDGVTDGWDEKVFDGHTQYQVTDRNGRMSLRAISEGTGSGLFMEKRIDLKKTPFINWSWLAEKSLAGIDETAKSGDDYVARIYLVIDGGMMLWRTRSINYVWSSMQDAGSGWDNAFAGKNVKMIAVRGKEAEAGRWYQEKRNVYADLIERFGDKGSVSANEKSYRYIDIIALMTDTDNSKQNAVSYYGDIFFSEQ
ncbi:DUF3047 domain-containing protein [Veronia pacifica]|uniref:DUF3047 domain-containing protein n=1 Tax=Veronia pacifica TaxID=1080227 RepID=A0A1C3EA64_9GAMM|nr:DUF3047 domain-containing protein [Veronia pacifica]ODA30131.1 hypothetical protein A8L45_21050 [Veronia pacifica]